jgi:integrase
MSSRTTSTRWRWHCPRSSRRGLESGYRQDFDTELEAQQWEADSRAKLLKGETLDGKAGEACSTLRQLLDTAAGPCWGGNKAEGTSVANAEDCIRTLGEDRPPSSVDTLAIDRMIVDFKRRGNSGGTINRKLAALSKLMKYAITRGWIRNMPTFQRQRESEHRIRWITPDEEKRILDWLQFTNQLAMKDLVVLLVDSGCRAGEAFKLRWADIDNGWLRLWDTKNGGHRSVPMTDRVKLLLARREKDRPDGADLVFHDLDYWAAAHAWNQLRDHLKLEHDDQFVIHALRHTFCSRLAQAGVPLLTIKELAGHRVIQTTMRYAHLRAENLESGIAALNKVTAEQPQLRMAQ